MIQRGVGLLFSSAVATRVSTFHAQFSAANLRPSPGDETRESLVQISGSLIATVFVRRRYIPRYEIGEIDGPSAVGRWKRKEKRQGESMIREENEDSCRYRGFRQRGLFRRRTTIMRLSPPLYFRHRALLSAPVLILSESQSSEIRISSREVTRENCAHSVSSP